jgi:hypothetical protein
MELEMWCPYAQKMTVVRTERLPVYSVVGSTVKVTDCFKSCRFYKTSDCLINKTVEGAFYW